MCKLNLNLLCYVLMNGILLEVEGYASMYYLGLLVPNALPL